MKTSKLSILSFCAVLAAVSACSQTKTDKIGDAAKQGVQNVTATPGVKTASVGEFWASDLKPKGYSTNIGPVLALKMEANKQDPTRKYDVLVELWKTSLESVSEICDTSTWKAWDSTGTILDNADCYIAKLTAEDITKLADKARLCYIGSGEKYDSSTESAEWIEALGEYTGDQVIFDSNGGLILDPDDTYILDDYSSIELWSDIISSGDNQN